MTATELASKTFVKKKKKCCMEQGVLYLLGQSVRKEQCSDCATELASKAFVLLVQDAAAEMVVMCCRFLCYFCRTSRQNQRAMFEHLSYMLDNSSMLLGKLSGVGRYVDDFLICSEDF